MKKYIVKYQLMCQWRLRSPRSAVCEAETQEGLCCGAKARQPEH